VPSAAARRAPRRRCPASAGPATARRLQPAGPGAGDAAGNPVRLVGPDLASSRAATVTISGAAAAMSAACPGPGSPP